MDVKEQETNCGVKPSKIYIHTYIYTCNRTCFEVTVPTPSPHNNRTRWNFACGTQRTCKNSTGMPLFSQHDQVTQNYSQTSLWAVSWTNYFLSNNTSDQHRLETSWFLFVLPCATDLIWEAASLTEQTTILGGDSCDWSCASCFLLFQVSSCVQVMQYNLVALDVYQPWAWRLCLFIKRVGFLFWLKLESRNFVMGPAFCGGERKWISTQGLQTHTFTWNLLLSNLILAYCD